jgi:anti-sigma-K factor RskA
MSDQRAMDDERRSLAAEYALGVLTGADRKRARQLAAGDPQFRAEVAGWLGRLSPLLEDVEPVQPPAGTWRGIEARIGAGRGEAGNVISLHRRLRMWQGIAGAATALAASLALVVAIPQPTVPTSPSERQPGRPMVAMLSDEQKDMKLVASWDPAGQRLVLAVAGQMPGDPEHVHELWVIPSGGTPRSLGTMREPRTHMQLADAIAQLMRQGATIAISVEPRGGSPTGQPTGPVIASGTLESA